jgi:integrase
MKSTLTASKISKLEPGRHFDGGCPGLFIEINSDCTVKKFVLRVQIDKKRQDFILGRFPQLSLPEARAKATSWRESIKAGKNPSDGPTIVGMPTFMEWAIQLHPKLEKQWRNSAYSKNWLKSLELHCKNIKDVPLDMINYKLIEKDLAKIWLAQPETARRVKQRINLIMTNAVKHGLINSSPPLPTNNDLGKPPPFKRGHHRSMDWHQAHFFYQELRKQRQTEVALCLQFLILSALRNKEARELEWSEVDLGKKVATIRADRMKNNKEFRLPLTDAMLHVLTLDKQLNPETQFVFGRKLSDMACAMLQRRQLNWDGGTHGWRSTFKTWATDMRMDDIVSEFALSHFELPVGLAAYMRTDLLEQRRIMMNHWNDQLLFGTSSEATIPDIDK